MARLSPGHVPDPVDKAWTGPCMGMYGGSRDHQMGAGTTKRVQNHQFWLKTTKKGCKTTKCKKWPISGPQAPPWRTPRTRGLGGS